MKIQISFNLLWEILESGKKPVIYFVRIFFFYFIGIQLDIIHKKNGKPTYETLKEGQNNCILLNECV